MKKVDYNKVLESFSNIFIKKFGFSFTLCYINGWKTLLFLCDCPRNKRYGLTNWLRLFFAPRHMNVSIVRNQEIFVAIARPCAD